MLFTCNQFLSLKMKLGNQHKLLFSAGFFMLWDIHEFGASWTLRVSTKRKFQRQSFYSLGTWNLFLQFMAKGVVVYSSKWKAILFPIVCSAIMGNPIKQAEICRTPCLFRFSTLNREWDTCYEMDIKEMQCHCEEFANINRRRQFATKFLWRNPRSSFHFGAWEGSIGF